MLVFFVATYSQWHYIPLLVLEFYPRCIQSIFLPLQEQCVTRKLFSRTFQWYCFYDHKARPPQIHVPHLANNVNFSWLLCPTPLNPCPIQYCHKILGICDRISFSLLWPYLFTVNSPFPQSLLFVQTKTALTYLHFFIRI